jgi:hypothetical protein
MLTRFVSKSCPRRSRGLIVTRSMRWEQVEVVGGVDLVGHRRERDIGR